MMLRPLYHSFHQSYEDYGMVVEISVSLEFFIALWAYNVSTDFVLTDGFTPLDMVVHDDIVLQNTL